MSRGRSTALALALTVPWCGCASLRGSGWAPRGDAPTAGASSADAAGPPIVRLLAFGDAGHGTGSERQVAAELDRALADSRKNPGELPVVLWLGDNLGARGPVSGSAPSGPCRDQRAGSGDAAIAAVVRRHQKEGVPSFAVLGPLDWSCGAPQLEFQDDSAGPRPWVMPTYNYVVRVYASGEARVASYCSDGSRGAPLCEIKPIAEGDGKGEDEGSPLLELVMLDTAPWNQPMWGEPVTPAEQASVDQQRALLSALRAASPEGAGGPLRLLVTHHPLETAGPHGAGGRYPDSAFRYTAPALREAIDDGLFEGVISAHDRNLQIAADVSGGVKRSSRFWLDHPVFQVVAGATSRPDGRAGAGPRRRGYYRGQSLVPDLFTNHAGFAELRVDATSIEAVLHARRRGRWRVGSVTIPRSRPRHLSTTPSPGMEPCVACDTRPVRPP